RMWPKLTSSFKVERVRLNQQERRSCYSRFRYDAAGTETASALRGPAVGLTALQTLRLLLHQRRRATRAGAALMPMAQGMADFVVDQVLPVSDDVVEFLGRRDPALGVEDDVGAVAARELAEGAQGQAHLVDGVGTGDRDHRVLPVIDEFDGDVADVLPAAFVLERVDDEVTGPVDVDGQIVLDAHGDLEGLPLLPVGPGLLGGSLPFPAAGGLDVVLGQIRRPGVVDGRAVGGFAGLA